MVLKISGIGSRVGLALVLLLTAGALPAAAAGERVDKISNSGFDKTVEQLQKAVKQRGAMIVATIDHQNMLRMVGASAKGAKTIEFGKPDMMKMLIPENPEIALEMPLRIYVFERSDGKTVVSYRKLSEVFASYGKEQLKMPGQMMDMMLEEISGEAAK